MRFRLFILLVFITAMLSGCEKARQIVTPQKGTATDTCTDGTRVLKVGFYAHFAPVSYSANEDPDSAEFNTHLGYEADLLTALEAMEGAGLTFSRTAIAEWDGIWLKSTEPMYDIIGGGITILESRRQDATGMPVVTFTSGHIQFRQTLLVRAEDAERLSTHAALNNEVRVGALPGTTGEARLLQLTGFVDTEGVLLSGTRIETRDRTAVADGTAAYTITAAGASPNLAGRQHLYPPTETMPQIIYLGEVLGEAELLEALVAGRIDAIARGEIGSQDAAHASHGELVVTAFDDQIEYGGFTLALEDANLAACLDEKLDYLTDNKNIGYGEWLQDPSVFMKRAKQWNAIVE
ncbi:MAG: transporter substrate-binding domain-containing protein [Candidatus Poribacteria bacterium]|nr:transporter substrate-binding domain-containing protein [Candidatus Poribacteria bacterium]